MIALFVVLYVAGIWLFYVRLKVKPNPINLAVCVVIGLVAVMGIVIGWQHSAPTSGQLVVTRFTIPIVPQVKGPVVKIHALPNVPLTKGKDILFEIQKEPFQYAVEQKTAIVGVTEKTITQIEASMKVADATIAEANANRDAAEADLNAKEDANRRSPGAVSALELAELKQRLAAGLAGVDKATAAREEAAASLEVARQQLLQHQAELRSAQFDLDQCVVYAPADGFVTNWQVREGSMVTPMASASVGTFVDTSEVSIAAVFSQNVLMNVAPGQKVEVALMNHPGEVYSGTVDSVIAATGEGQFQASGQLLSASSIRSSGKFGVKILLDDPQLIADLPMGTGGMATIYTDSGRPFQVISTVTMRIKAWVYYLLPF
ncbi:HlyD family secretion protein [Bremerella cremea]|uniref:HlyD family secretion protein n=1 Tax=Bremerella cremea TaxID=1031537 RepID=UPI0031E8BBBB